MLSKDITRFDFVPHSKYISKKHFILYFGSITMPIFEFRCVDCGEIFEKLFMNSDEKMEMACPQCNSASLDRVVSRTNYAIGVGPGGKQPRITTKSCGGSSNQCMSLDLPGPSE
jgi:putative FmdB family regulatory protein